MSRAYSPSGLRPIRVSSVAGVRGGDLRLGRRRVALNVLVVRAGDCRERAGVGLIPFGAACEVCLRVGFAFVLLFAGDLCALQERKYGW